MWIPTFWRGLGAVGSLAMLLFGQSIVARGAVLETLVVPTDGSSIQSTMVFPTGGSYLLQASGTFDIGGPGDGLGDAEYFNFSNPPMSVGDFSFGVDVGVVIDGVKPNWGSFDSNHVYTTGIRAQVVRCPLRIWTPTLGTTSAR